MNVERRDTSCFVVVNLDRITQGVAQITSILDALGIPLDVMESGRQLRWSTAVVLRIPEDRTADAMLALEMKGFADVMAYHSNDV